MNKLIAVIFAAMFAAVSFQAVAQDKTRNPPPTSARRTRR